MTTNRTIASEEKTRRVAAGSGTAFALLSAVAVVLDRGPMDTSTTRALLAHFVENRSAIWWSALLFGFAAVALLIFASAVGSLIVGPDWRRGAILAGGVGVGLLQLAGEGSWFVLARQPEIALLQVFQEAWLFHDLADSFFVMENFPAIALVGALALIALDLGLPLWQRTVGLVLTIGIAINSAIQLLDNEGIGEVTGPVTLSLAILWALQYSVVLGRTSSRPATVANVVGDR